MAEEQRYVSAQSDSLSQERGRENPGGSSGDPLAELARLMGQDQRLARSARKDSERPSSAGPAEVPNWLNRPAKPTAGANGDAAAVDLPPAPDLGSWRGRFADLESVLGRSLAISSDIEPTQPDGAEEPRAVVNGHGALDSKPSHTQPVAADLQTKEEEGSDPYRTADYDGRYEAEQEVPAGQADQRYYAEDAIPPHSDRQPIAAAAHETSYDPPATWRHLSLQRGILALLGLVVVGSVAAYGYRSLAGHGSGVPPIIKASTEPAKVMTSAQGSDSQAGKQIYDRLDNPRGQAQTETMVPRQEEPIALPTQSAQPPAVVPTAASGAASAAPGSLAPAVAALPPLVGGTPTNGEPKRVRTVTIRPEQPPPAATTVQDLAGMAAAQSWPSPPPSAPAPATAFPPPPAPVAAASTTPAPPPHAQTRAIRKPKPAASEPMAIGPQAEASAAAAEQVAASPAPRAAPTRLAALPPAAEGGHYAVQVSSQRSEAEAHASFRAMQQKYPSVLGGREALIRRADLGSRGVYYRAQVGPFPTAEEANRMCSALRAAGGQCIIQHD